MKGVIIAAVSAVVAALCFESYQEGKRRGIALAGNYMLERFEEMREALIAERRDSENNKQQMF